MVFKVPKNDTGAYSRIRNQTKNTDSQICQNGMQV